MGTTPHEEWITYNQVHGLPQAPDEKAIVACVHLSKTPVAVGHIQMGFGTQGVNPACGQQAWMTVSDLPVMVNCVECLQVMATN